jgi:hypothetical protein
VWEDVLNLPTSVEGDYRGSAYAGLCNVALAKKDAALEKKYVAYFYCKRAEAVDARLLRLRPSDPQLRWEEAHVLDTLGIILNRVKSTEVNTIEEWHCNPQFRTIYTGYTRQALNYFNRAKALSPITYQPILCHAASTALALGDKQPMKALGADARAHLLLARTFRKRAQLDALRPLINAHSVLGMVDEKDVTERRQIRERASSNFARAVQEFENAIRMDETDPTAFNGYARTNWMWYTLIPDDLSKIERSLAHEHALRAISLVATQEHPEDEGGYRDTLAEVLLIDKILPEAIKELELAVDLEARASALHNPLHHETLWDLAQAYCASSNDDIRIVGSTREENIAKALLFLDEIEQDEEVIEGQPLTGLIPPPACSSAYGAESHDNQRYALQRGEDVSAADASIGDSFNLRVGAYDVSGESARNLLLRLWTRDGQDRQPKCIPLADHSTETTIPIEQTHEYYFVQLKQLAGWKNKDCREQKAVSRIYAFRVFAKDRQPENREPIMTHPITLIFTEQSAADIGHVAGSPSSHR